MRLPSAPCLTLALIGSLVSAAPADAENEGPASPPVDDLTAEVPRGTMVVVDEDMYDVAEPVTENQHSSNIIFLNGCFGGGCAINPGYESSVNNTSSIVRGGTAYISQFSHGQVVWDSLVECVRETYAPFNIEVTDVDPGSEPHFEAIVAGVPQELGLSNGIGGIAPSGCGVINNAITYSFANYYQPYVPQICWTVAQETAHAFGLDHEYLCQDPMTYLSSCGAEKAFMDISADCGEFEPRGCRCSLDGKQNSYQKILAHFGPGTPTPPNVNIVEPPDGAKVDVGWVVQVEASDDIEVDRVELKINGQVITTADTEPWVFNVPEMSDGRMKVEVRAIDNYGFENTAVANVVQGEPCSKAKDCADLETCVDGRCVDGPGSPGGLGEPCDNHEQCSSGLCGEAAEGKFCAERCEVGEGGCPKGFGCADVGEYGVCWRGYDDGSDEGGCSAGGGAGGLPVWLLGLTIVGLVIRRRRS